MGKQDYSRWSREDLEQRSEELRKQRTEIREEQVEVDGLLDAHRELDRLNLNPEQIQKIHHLAEVRAESATAAAKKESKE